MRKVINGRTYNTETSKEIGTDVRNRSNFNYCHETLYRNTKGAYFIHGDGGPSSRYARRVDQNSWAGGEAIVPLTSAEAQEWAEKHLTAEELEAEFGEQPEAESDLVNRERVGLTLGKDVMAGMRKLSRETGVPMSTMIDRAILAMYGDKF